jgi:protein-glutamine gamma-glutamyltransferase
MTAPDRTRPLGAAPGALAFAAAWIVAGMIARLTGTPVVVALMAALAVLLGAEFLTGRSAVLRVRPSAITVAPTTTAGTPTALDVEFLARHRPDRVGRIRLLTAHRSEVASTALAPDELRRGRLSVDAVFDRPGIVDSITAVIEYSGPFGLLWWRRTTSVPVATIHVAPAASTRTVDHLERHRSPLDGDAASERGNHLGDIDGVRVWRDGDPVGSIHWPSTLRSGDLIVHDRTTTSDERWEVDLDELTGRADGDTAARVRHTLEEGVRLGHRVQVVHRDQHHSVVSIDDAARWSAVVAGSMTSSHPSPEASWWRRPLRLVHDDEPAARVSGPARWATAAAAGCSLLMLVGALSRSLLFVAAVVAGLALGAAVSQQLGGRRPRLLQVAIVAVIVGALAMIAADASGVGGLLEALRGPLPNLLVLLVVLHGFEAVDRRTVRVHQAITFVIAAYAAGLRIDGALGWWIGAWGAALLTAMALTVRTRPAEANRIPDARTTGRALTGLAGGAIATLAVLSVVPIPDGPARLGLPALSTGNAPIDTPGALAAPGGSTTPSPSSGERGSIGGVVGYPGFTDTLDTTIRGDLGDEVVMRVRAPEPAFWRGQTFSEFDGRAWRVSPERGTRQEGPNIEVAPTLGDGIADDVVTETFVQTYFVETDLPNVVFAAARPSEVIFDGDLWTRPDGALRSDITLAPGSVYTVVSQRPQVTAGLLRAQGDLGEFFGRFVGQPGTEELDAFLDVPDSTTQRTIDLATELREETTYDTIIAYERWLGANTRYDLDAPVPAEGADAVDDFLFESRLGYCEQIASTLAVMLRSQGVPARLATGYIPGERDRVSGVWKVRASDAHSWVEVWFPQTGWQAFDPTASVPLAGETGAGTIGGDLIAATASSVAAYRVELAAFAAAVAAGWLGVVAALRWRARRRRGRWGLLQDRFAALDPHGGDTPRRHEREATNPERASQLQPPDVAAAVAQVLDRAAFDPGWVDDDELYERTRAGVGTLERQRR